jgi:hypothetical protein
MKLAKSSTTTLGTPSTIDAAGALLARALSGAAFDLLQSAAWRELVAAEFPGDERNLEASRLLKGLALEVIDLAASEIGVNFALFVENVIGTNRLDSFVSAALYFRSRIGFDRHITNHVTTGAEYLLALMDLNVGAIRAEHGDILVKDVHHGPRPVARTVRACCRTG